MPTNAEILYREKSTRASQSLVKTIAPGGLVSLNCYGNFYYFVEASGAIEARTEKSSWIPHNAGTGEIYPDDNLFGRLEIRNEGSEDVTITVFIGFDTYIDNRFTVIPGRLDSILFSADAPTEIITEEIELDPLEALTFDGEPPDGFLQRKQIWAIKTGSDGDPWFVDDDGNKIVPIRAAADGGAFVLDVSGSLAVKNFDAVDSAEINVSQNWFKA